MKVLSRSILIRGLRQLVTGLVNFCLRHSITAPELENCIRQAFVKAAQDDLQKRSEEHSVSRLSVITGLNRRQVQQILKQDTANDDYVSFIMKVVGQWQNDKKFVDSNKKPLPLTFGFEKSEFSRLVKTISKELNPATVLFELERVGAAKRIKSSEGEEQVELVLEVYQPAGDLEAGFAITGRDIGDYIEVSEENIIDQPSISNLHLRTEYDRIRPEGMIELKKWLLQEGYAFHDRARDKFAQFDQDVNPDPTFTGNCTRIVLGSFGKVFAPKERK